jgi:UDP-N-acetyl-D-galactosamine dehydrogenase
VETLERVATIYESIVSAGVQRMSSIRAAELTKLLENVQRDLNIALMNELSALAHGLDLDPAEIIAAAATKWNFLPFRPGLVGGACLSLAGELWEHTRRALDFPTGVVAHGRGQNERTVDFVVEQTARILAQRGVPLCAARVVQWGATFKANVPVTAASKNVELATKLGALGPRVWLHDPHATLSSSLGPSVVVATSHRDLPPVCDLVVFAVAHDVLIQQPLVTLLAPLRPGGTVIDLTHALPSEDVRQLGFVLWHL